MIKKLGFIVALLLVVAACGDSGTSPTTAVTPTSTTAAPSGPSDAWSGQTTDTSQAALADVSININGVETQSDGSGQFQLDVPRADDSRYVINAQKAGFLPVSQIHIGAAIDGLALEFQPVEQMTVDPTEPIDVMDSSGTQIEIDANQLVDAEGNPATEELTLSMYTYDLTEEEMVGDMSAVNEDGEETSMESAGAFYAEFTDDDGTEYDLADGSQAGVSMPCEDTYPDEQLTVWSYDEETGLWVEEAPADIQNGECSAEVSHFSYWNFDWEKRDPACVALNVTAEYIQANSPVSVRAVLQTSPTRVRSFDVTETENVLINLPANTDVQIFLRPDLSTPFATVNTGEPWGGTGVPSKPYDAVCNGTVQIPVADPPPEPEPSSLAGNVVDATTDQPIAGAEICVSGTDQCASTDDSGNYAISGVTAGDLVLTAGASGFISVDDQAVTIASGADVTQDFALSPVLASGELRIVLTWGDNPSDLDSHLWQPDATEIEYGVQGQLIGGAILDVDDTTGRGPETITIKEAQTGSYTYAVYDFDQTGLLTTSSAVVRVYSGDRELAMYPVPTTGSGTWWHVFDLDAMTATITPVNTLSNAPPVTN